MPIPKAIQEEITRYEHTKAVFMNCERVLRTSSFSGAECEQVTECIALIRYMVKETNTNIKNIRESAKKKDVPAAAPPATVAPENDLGAHLPEEK